MKREDSLQIKIYKFDHFVKLEYADLKTWHCHWKLGDTDWLTPSSFPASFVRTIKPRSLPRSLFRLQPTSKKILDQSFPTFWSLGENANILIDVREALTMQQYPARQSESLLYKCNYGGRVSARQFKVTWIYSLCVLCVFLVSFITFLMQTTSSLLI